MDEFDAQPSNHPVPKHNKNPIRSLRPAPMFLMVAGQEVEIPALSAADWLQLLMSDNWTPDTIFMEFVPGGLDLLMRQEDVLDPVTVEDLVLEMIEEASSRSWWIALRLVSAIQNGWEVVGGEMILRQLDPATLSLAGWLDAMMLIVLKAIKPDEHAMFIARLEVPPLGVEMPAEDMEMSAEQFMSMMRD